MRPNLLRRAGVLVFVPGLVVLATPAVAGSRLRSPTVVRLAPPLGSMGFGGTVAGLGDVDGDGMGDVGVGAPDSDQAYVISGGTGAILRNIIAPAAPGLRFGAALAPAGDVDQDGVPDLVVGAPSEPPVVGPACPSSAQCGGRARGRAFLFSGASGAMIRELMPLTTGDADFGRSVTGASDLSGDGVPDIVVGAPGHTNGPGSTIAFSGANGAQLWSRPDPSMSFGELVVSAPDLSGDGIADVLVSSPSTSSGGLPAPGRGQVLDLLVGTLNQVLNPGVPDRVHFLSGATGAVVRSISDPARTGNDAFGASLAPAGDQDGDGVGDHLIGERGANHLHVYSGKDGVLIRSMAAPVDARGQGGFTLAHVDDKDGDGRDDFWLGIGSARAVYLLNDKGTVLASAAGPSPVGGFATAVGTIGNIGGDPGTDLVVGDPSEPGGGAAYLLHTGPDAAPAVRAEPGVAVDGARRLRAQTTVPTTTASSTTTTTTGPVTTTTDVPATAILPKPATAPTSGGEHPGTGGVDRRTAGMAALGLGMTGITFLRRLREPSVRRPPSTG